ncbi:X-ray repair cross-complementing protein 5-like isoform X3 [Aphis craccivora]|uniref:X-ray repair cross-complementing protein 5-like isoform X3 n=1 Tax=Aphis craccivora TaxID=307492 RepID=A0A6G0YTF0_APHCR|nr:X-ray repair cross-complementing protein 5-like isoform X3 [Aphis craccivora]
MRRNTSIEAIVLAIDVGKSSLQLDSDGKTYFEKSKFCVSMILKRKIFAESKDCLALILFGSSHTNNHLSYTGCYDNIEVVTSLGIDGIVTWDLVKHIDSLSSADITPSNWLNTLVLAADILKKETEEKIFKDLQIVMFSNLETDVSFDKLNIIASCLKTQNINLTIVGKDCEVLSLNPKLETFIMETEATAINFDSVLPKLSHYKQKEVTPRAWNIPLSFGNIFNIRVSGYKKIDESAKSLKWLLCKNYDTEDSITAMKKHTTYFYIENSEQIEVDREDIIDGFRFGDTIIPVSDLDTDAYSYKSGPRCLQVLGFTKAKNIQRSFLMDGGSYIFKPHKEDIVAFKVIFNAMVEREELMIVRKVYSNNCLPTIGVMFPQKEDTENIEHTLNVLHYFVCVNLPFAEDEHLFKLPSLKSFKPNHEENNAVRNLIDAMDLDKDGNELFMPENTHDPELQYVYDCIAQKAINPNKLLTKTIPEHIQSLLNPPKRIMEKSKQTINEIIKIFSLQQEKYEKFLVEDKNIVQFDCDEEIDFSKQCIITAFSPIEDFNKLLENGFNSVIVCENMKHITLDLIESSTSMEDLEKPALNLKVLRDFYINNNDIKSYNNLMYLVKDSVLISGKEGMWSQFVDSGIGLITNQEIEISDISQELSEQFMKHEVLQDVAEEFSIDDDDPLKEFL